MKKHYDFSQAEQGKLYRPAHTLRIPIYLDQDVQNKLMGRERRTDLSKLVNAILRSQESTGGLRRTVSAVPAAPLGGSSSRKRRYPCFAVCIDNTGNEGSLRVGKVYQVVKPERHDGPNDVRVIDEEGEDYLYSAEQFVPVTLPPEAKRAVISAVPSTS
jgi:hypothetical protein